MVFAVLVCTMYLFKRHHPVILYPGLRFRQKCFGPGRWVIAVGGAQWGHEPLFWQEQWCIRCSRDLYTAVRKINLGHYKCRCSFWKITLWFLKNSLLLVRQKPLQNPCWLCSGLEKFNVWLPACLLEWRKCSYICPSSKMHWQQKIGQCFQPGATLGRLPPRGIYLDTDVEMKKQLMIFTSQVAFWERKDVERIYVNNAVLVQ